MNTCFSANLLGDDFPSVYDICHSVILSSGVATAADVGAAAGATAAGAEAGAAVVEGTTAATAPSAPATAVKAVTPPRAPVEATGAAAAVEGDGPFQVLYPFCFLFFLLCRVLYSIVCT